MILVVRADFFANLQNDSVLGPRLEAEQVNVLPITEEELRAIIERPAEVSGCHFEPGLVDTIMQDAFTQPGKLPLLEFALTQLWQLRTREGMLTFAAYRDIGRVSKALANAADKEYENLEGKKQIGTMKWVLVRLVRPGIEPEDTRGIRASRHGQRTRQFAERPTGSVGSRMEYGRRSPRGHWSRPDYWAGNDRNRR